MPASVAMFDVVSGPACSGLGGHSGWIRSLEPERWRIRPDRHPPKRRSSGWYWWTTKSPASPRPSIRRQYAATLLIKAGSQQDRRPGSAGNVW